MKIKKQEDIKDCGPLVVQAIHNLFYSKWIDINEIKLKVDFGDKGVNIKNLIDLMQEYGIKGDAYEASIETIASSKSKDSMVGIINSEGMNHYVIFQVKRKKVHISDSIKGNYKMSIEEFEKIFQNKIIVFEKSDYKPKKINLKHPIRYLSKNYNFIGWITISLLLSIAFTFISSLFMKIIMDKVIPGKLQSTLLIVCLSFSFLAILKSINKLIRAYLIKRLTLQIEKDITFNYFNKLNYSKYMDLSKITLNDNLRRIGLISHVSGFIANSFFVLVNEFTMFLVSTSLLIWISPTLFSISLLAGGLIALTTAIFRILTRESFEQVVQSQMNIFDAMVDTVNQPKELKIPSYSRYNEVLFNKKWIKSKRVEFDIWKFSSFQNLTEVLIETLAPVILIYIGVNKIFDDQLTVGSVLMFSSIFNSFIAPIKDICDFFFKLPQMQKNMNLISFVLNLSEEEKNPNGLSSEKISYIYLKNIKAGYDRTIINLKSLMIDSSLKIVGSNGSGKSTLLNVINTTLETKGKVIYNDFEKEFYSLDSLRERMITLSPSTYIPNMSVLEFVTQLDRKAIKTLKKNLNKYNIASLLNSLNLSLDTPLVNNGQNISSGQRQAVLLLKLFTRKYDVIMLDEAFENIDRKKLEGIKDALNQFQDSIFIEISHSKRYVSEGKEINLEEINENT